MLFNSFEFIFAFLPAVILLFYFVLPKKFRMLMLLLMSYLFYGYWNYKFIPLIIFSTYCDFYIGKKLYDEKSPQKKKWLLAASVMINLGVLGFFKYFNFTIDNINFLLAFFEYDQIERFTNIVLPIGISFYTFQSMSYTIDLYRDHSKPYKNFISFATYVAFFPQLIAGPIIRHSDLVLQLEESVEKRIDVRKVALGIFFFIIGLGKKLVIADPIANAIDPVIGMMPIASTSEAWACAIGYTMQLYFDFSGYSDMAIGLGLFFGVKFPQNFNSPYKAYSITDFWRRWHITLSTWLRDYLYISLGGNRKGVHKTYINLFLTMLLGGLWHGASWTYIIWGCLHGSFLAIERFLGLDKLSKNPLGKAAQYIFTFLVVICGWVIFRAESVEMMTTWFGKMFSIEGPLKLINFTARTRDRFAGAALIGMIIVWFFNNTYEIEKNFKPTKTKAFALSALLFASLLFLGFESPFLYFQF